MKTAQQPVSGIEYHKPSMIAGAAMMVAGGLIGLCGLITGGTAVFAAIRQYLREADMTAGEMVRQRVNQGRAAAAATASAWQHHDGAPARRVRS